MSLEWIHRGDVLGLELQIDDEEIAIGNFTEIVCERERTGILFKCNVRSDERALRAKAKKKPIVTFEFFDLHGLRRGKGKLDYPGGEFPYRLLFEGHY